MLLDGLRVRVPLSHSQFLQVTSLIIVAFTICSVGVHRAQRNTGNSIHFQTKEKESLSSVYGRVVYYGSEQPARRIRVVMRSLTSYGPEQLTGITNARGEFRIAGVPAGRYFIGVNGRGVVSTDSFIELDEARENRFDVTELRKYFEEVEVDGRTDKQVVIRAHRGGVITGKVSYANGDAAVDHPITILRRKGNRYSMFWINLTSMAYMLVTDDRGVFRVTGLPTGEYVVGATPMIEHGELIKDSTLEVNMVGSSLAMTFYPSTSLITKATPISIEAGEEKTGVDITIADQQFHTVAGTVRARDDHKPIASARITIIRKESYEKVGRAFWPYSMGMPGVNTDEQGRWRFGEVPDGRYIIFVEPPTEYDQPSTTTKRYGSKQQEIEVSGGNINNLLIEVGDDATIAGTVVVESGPMPAGIYLWLTTEGISSGVSANATVQPGGRFVIRNVPAAKMYFAVNLEQDIERFYLKSITWNGKDLLREPLDITADTKIDGVKIVLSREVASFTIRVRNNRGEPVPDVSLTLVSSDRARWVRREEQLFGNTNAQGNCTIIGAPGEYLVFVLPRGVQGSTLEKDEIEQGAAQAPRVSLRPGERRTFDVVLPPDR